MARLSAILSSPSDIFWCCAKVWNISARTDGVSAFITNICVKTKYNVEFCYEKLRFIWSLFFLSPIRRNINTFTDPTGFFTIFLHPCLFLSKTVSGIQNQAIFIIVSAFFTNRQSCITLGTCILYNHTDITRKTHNTLNTFGARYTTQTN